MYKLTKDNNILIFKYKFLHRNIITNRNLNLWDRTNNVDLCRSDRCSFCELFEETLEHLFFDCEITNNFWDRTFQWIGECTNVRLCFSKPEILLGGAPKELDIFNLIFMIGLKYIYYSKITDQKPIINLFKYILTQHYNAEKLIAQENNKLELFNNKWDLIDTCF